MPDNMKKINTPLTDDSVKRLTAGEEVLLTGVIYTARDQAHKRLCELIAGGRKLPFDLKGQVVYYCGPTRTPKGKVIGSCGPTTSRRMDAFAPVLLASGLRGMIGKGGRSAAVRAGIKKHRGVYFLAYAGCGALVSRYVRKCRVVAFPELGPEAVRRLEVKDLPLIVGMDSRGKSVF